MKRVLTVALAAACVAGAAAELAAAKEFQTLVLVGADGRSVELEPRRGVLASFFDGASPVNRGRTWTPVRARPRGGFVLVYLLGAGGFPGIPGRYYPANRAACFDWSQIGPHPLCHRPNPTLLRLLAGARGVPLLRTPTLIDRLWRGERVVAAKHANLKVALNMAFARSRASVFRSRPAACLEFRATWRGPEARPRTFCLSPAGAWAAGRLYPLGRAVWSFARLNS